MPRDGTGPVPEDDRRDSDDTGRRKAVVALVVVLGLVVVSFYIGHVLKRSSALEDCEMQGRTNCAPIDTGAAK
jgi:hypothetical protein